MGSVALQGRLAELSFLLGEHRGAETMHATRWAPAGAAVGVTHVVAVLGGRALRQDYVQQRDGATAFEMLTVFMLDDADDRLLGYTFDTAGFAPTAAVGRWTAGELVWRRESPRGEALVAHAPTAAGWTHRRAFRPVGGKSGCRSSMRRWCPSHRDRPFSRASPTRGTPTVHAAILNGLGEAPSYGTFEDPSPAPGQEVVRVLAAGVNHLDLAKATGKFYTGPPPIPSVVGSDGVGVTADGRRVFFDSPVPPYGTWAEKSLVSSANLLQVADGVGDAVAAALGNTGLAAWLALQWRAQLQPGESVLVLAASGALGSVAVQAARLLGAGRVVAADRSAQRLERIETADATVVLDGGPDMVERLRAASPAGYDVIIDPLWGAPAVAAMQAAARGARHIQVGHLAGADITLPAPVIRSAAVDVRGMAAFHASLEIRQASYLTLTEHAARGELTVNLEEIPLARVQDAWRRQAAGPGTKLVLVPG